MNLKKLRSIPSPFLSLSFFLNVDDGAFAMYIICLNVCMCIRKQASQKCIFYGNDDGFVGEAFLKRNKLQFYDSSIEDQANYLLFYVSIKHTHMKNFFKVFSSDGNSYFTQ